jgi:glc operon protein GlcG
MTTNNQQIRISATIAVDAALTAIAAGMAEATRRGAALSFAVVDSAGHLVAAARMDGAPFSTLDIARGKAFACAATGGQPGGELAKRFAENPAVWSNAGPLGSGAPLLPARGSLPIRQGAALVGAMAASGAPSEVDEAVVTHALATLGLDR